MGTAYSARQSSYTDGDTIDAADSNDEFDAILAAFGTSGHSHDGTAGEGGAITALRGHALTFGQGTAGTDVVLTFDGETSDGVLSWMEDEDHFKFDDDVKIIDDKKIILGTNDDITVKYDETTNNSLEIAANVEGAALGVVLKADQGDDAGDEWKLNIADGGTLTFGNDINSAGTYVTHLTLTPNATVANSTAAFAGNVTVANTLSIGGTAITSTGAELNKLDGVTSTAAELSIVDGDTSATSTTVADADRVVFNDGGTMKQVAVTDLAAYFDDEITAMPNLTSVGTLTTLTVDNVIINGSTIGHTSDTDLMTVADGVLTVAGEVSMTTLDIGGTNVTSTAAEINLLDGGTSVGGSITVADSDGFIVNDGGTMKTIPASDLKTYAGGSAGADGDDGVGGLPYTFSTTTTDSDPGAGVLRLNNGTLGSVSEIYIDDSTAASGNPDVSAFILTWDDSTQTSDRGQITIAKKSAQQNFAIYKISGASTDASGYVKLAVTHVVSNGSFSNTDDLLVSFARTGDAGSLADPMTTRGDIIFRNSSNATARLAVGAANRVLISDGTDPSYGQVPLASAVSGTLPIANGGTGSTSAADARTAIGAEAADADILKADTADVLTAGFAASVHDLGTISSGTTTLDEANGNLQKCVNGGAFTLAPPSNSCTIVLQVTNNASAGSVTTSGFTLTDGDTISTGNGDDFFFYVTVVGSFSHLTVKKLS